MKRYDDDYWRQLFKPLIKEEDSIGDQIRNLPTEILELIGDIWDLIWMIQTRKPELACVFLVLLCHLGPVKQKRRSKKDATQHENNSQQSILPHGGQKCKDPLGHIQDA